MTKDNIVQEIRRLLQDEVGKSRMSESAYDIGWLVRLADNKRSDHPRYPKLLERLRNIQHADGSWGSQIPFAHDRVISTLSVIAGASTWPLDDQWEERIHKGLRAVEKFAPKLLDEPEATVAFELLFPKLLNEVKQRGHAVSVPPSVLAYYNKLYKEKLAKLPLKVVTSRPTTLLHALEALDDSVDLGPVAQFMFQSGSYGSSPSSTAYLVKHHIAGPLSIAYLDRFVEEGIVPTMSPVDIFERAWCLLPFFIFGFEQEFQKDLLPHLQYLETSWTENGVGPSREFSIPDLDDTSVVFYLLQKKGTRLNPQIFEHFETVDGFMCFPGERSGSASYYAHLYFALSTCSDDERVLRMKEKTVRFLERTKTSQGFWDDKWHGSPYYVTSRIILALLEKQENRSLIDQSVAWLLSKQQSSGLWGLYKGSVEETAYVLMALSLYSKQCKPVSPSILAKGVSALQEHYAQGHFQELWIGKALFGEELITRLTALTVLLYDQRPSK